MNLGADALGPVGALVLSLAAIAWLVKFIDRLLKEAREDRNAFEEKNEERWKIVNDLVGSHRELVGLVRLMNDRRD